MNKTKMKDIPVNSYGIAIDFMLVGMPTMRTY